MCHASKANNEKLSVEFHPREAQNPWELIYSDICGPLSMSKGGNSSSMDDLTSMAWFSFLSTKSAYNTFNAWIEFKANAKTHFPVFRIKRFRRDMIMEGSLKQPQLVLELECIRLSPAPDVLRKDSDRSHLIASCNNLMIFAQNFPSSSTNTTPKSAFISLNFLPSSSYNTTAFQSSPSPHSRHTYFA